MSCEPRLALPFLATGSSAFLAEGGTNFFWQVGDGALLFRGGGGFLDVAAGGDALLGAGHSGVNVSFSFEWPRLSWRRGSDPLSCVCERRRGPGGTRRDATRRSAVLF